MRFSFRDGYQGSSFSEFLTSEFPHLLPDLSGLAAPGGEVKVAHGTTVLGLRFALLRYAASLALPVAAGLLTRAALR